MNKKRMDKIKLTLLSVLTLGLLAACNTTDDYEENPEQPPAVEEPADDTGAETP